MSIQCRLRHRLGAFRLDADFEAGEGAVTALFGPSGAGKTSIVHALAGLMRPDQGRIVVKDEVLLDTEAGIFVAAERRRMGLVFQDARLFPHMTVRDNLLFGWRRAPHPVPEAEIARIIALLGLEAFLARKPRGLSGGEKARVALGRALLSSPRLLLLDEPLASLDAARREEILPWLERLRDDIRLPMIYVSHAGEEVARLADHVVLLEDGRVTAQGPVSDMLLGRAMAMGRLGGLIDAVAANSRADGLTELAFDGGVFAVPQSLAPGRRVRLRIAAEDILIATGEPSGLSANNMLSATVADVRGDGVLAEVEMLAGSVRLLARITAASAQRLALAPGLRVHAIVKSVAVDRSISGL
jgi:molybdate transport system ATP-binding protein